MSSTPSPDSTPISRIVVEGGHEILMPLPSTVPETGEWTSSLIEEGRWMAHYGQEAILVNARKPLGVTPVPSGKIGERAPEPRLVALFTDGSRAIVDGMLGAGPITRESLRVGGTAFLNGLRLAGGRQASIAARPITVSHDTVAALAYTTHVWDELLYHLHEK